MTITHGVLDVYQLWTNFDGPQASGQVLLRAVDPHLLVLVLSRRLAMSEERFREVPSVLRLTSVCENNFKISENTWDLCPSPLCWCLLGRVVCARHPRAEQGDSRNLWPGDLAGGAGELCRVNKALPVLTHASYREDILCWKTYLILFLSRLWFCLFLASCTEGSQHVTIKEQSSLDEWGKDLAFVFPLVHIPMYICTRTHSWGRKSSSFFHIQGEMLGGQESCYTNYCAGTAWELRKWTWNHPAKTSSRLWRAD